jgi:hypothetical protein
VQLPPLRLITVQCKHGGDPIEPRSATCAISPCSRSKCPAGAVTPGAAAPRSLTALHPDGPRMRYILRESATLSGDGADVTGPIGSGRALGDFAVLRRVDTLRGLAALRAFIALRRRICLRSAFRALAAFRRFLGSTIRKLKDRTLTGAVRAVRGRSRKSKCDTSRQDTKAVGGRYFFASASRTFSVKFFSDLATMSVNALASMQVSHRGSTGSAASKGRPRFW